MEGGEAWARGTSWLKRCVRAGVGRLAYGLRRWIASDDFVVVAFHRVNDETAGDDITCSVADFDAFCRYFAANYEGIPGCAG